MYIPLILFFASLIGIILMVGRKLILFQRESVVTEENFLVQSPDLHKVRHAFIKNAKKYGYVALVATIRFSVRSSNFLKNKYKEAKNKITTKRHGIKRQENGKKEVSSFLKNISEYKSKIRKIRRKIIEEEKEDK